MRGLFVVGFAIAMSGCGDDAPPPLVDASVGADAAADAGPPGPTGSAPGTTLVDAMPVTLVNGLSAEITFDVPANASSLVVNVVGSDTAWFTLALWIGPDGEALVPDGWALTSEVGPQMCLSCPNRIAAQEGTAAVLAPNNPSATLVPGTHRVALLAFSVTDAGAVAFHDGEAIVTVTAKVSDAPPVTGLLDLDVYLTGAGGWTADNAATDARLQEVLSEVNRIYAQAGVRLGDVQYRDVPAEFRTIEGVSGAGNDLHRLLAEGRAGRRDALNLFFVDDLMLGGPFGGFGLLLGVAGGIPGPTLDDTNRSGVVINVGGHGTFGVVTPLHVTVAHEIGHYLGLFHSTEMNNPFLPTAMSIHDPLDDTAEDDPQNMMFFQPEGGMLSPSQQQVLQINPWVRSP